MVSQKETIYKSKRQPTKWGEKYLTMIITNKRLISKIHKKLIQFYNIKQTINLIKKWSEKLNDFSPKSLILINSSFMFIGASLVTQLVKDPAGKDSA